MQIRNQSEKNLVQRKVLKPEDLRSRLQELKKKEHEIYLQLDDSQKKNDLQLDIQLLQSEIIQISDILKRYDQSKETNNSKQNTQNKKNIFYSQQNNVVQQRPIFFEKKQSFSNMKKNNISYDDKQDPFLMLEKDSHFQKSHNQKKHDSMDANNRNVHVIKKGLDYSMENRNSILNEIQSDIESFNDIDDYEAVKNVFLENLEQKTEEEQIEILEKLKKMSHDQQVQFLQNLIEQTRQDEPIVQDSFQQFSFENQYTVQSQQRQAQSQKNLQVSKLSTQLIQKKNRKKSYELTNTLNIRQKSKSKSSKKKQDKFRIEFLNFSKLNQNLNKSKQLQNSYQKHEENHHVDINENKNILQFQKEDNNKEKQIQNMLKQNQSEQKKSKADIINNNSSLVYENLRQNLRFYTAPNLKNNNKFRELPQLSIEEFCYIPNKQIQAEQPLQIDKQIQSSSTSKLQELQQIQKPQFEIHSRKNDSILSKNQELKQTYINCQQQNYSLKEQFTKSDIQQEKKNTNQKYNKPEYILLQEEPIILTMPSESQKFNQKTVKVKEARQSAPNKLQRKISLITQNAQSEVEFDKNEKEQQQFDFNQDLISESENLKSIRLTQTENLTNFNYPLPSKLMNKEFSKYKAEEIKQKFKKQKNKVADIDYPQYNIIDEKTEEDTSIEELKSKIKEFQLKLDKYEQEKSVKDLKKEIEKIQEKFDNLKLEENQYKKNYNNYLESTS